MNSMNCGRKMESQEAVTNNYYDSYDGNGGIDGETGETGENDAAIPTKMKITRVRDEEAWERQQRKLPLLLLLLL